MNLWRQRVIDATEIITSRKGVGAIRERGTLSQVGWSGKLSSKVIFEEI